MEISRLRNFTALPLHYCGDLQHGNVGKILVKRKIRWVSHPNSYIKPEYCCLSVHSLKCVLSLNPRTCITEATHFSLCDGFRSEDRCSPRTSRHGRWGFCRAAVVLLYKYKYCGVVLHSQMAQLGSEAHCLQTRPSVPDSSSIPTAFHCHFACVCI